MPHRNPVARPWLSLPAAVAWMALGAAGAARAQDADGVQALRPLSESIKVSPGETCLDEARLERRIARWLERDSIDGRIGILVSGGPGATDVRFVVSRRGEAPAERILDAVPEPCDQLHAAVALSIALSIDATLLGQADVSDDEALGPEDDFEQEPQDPGIELPQPPDEALTFAPEVSVLLSAGIASGLVVGEAPVARLFVGFSPFPWVDVRLGALGVLARGRRFERVVGSYDTSLYGGRLDLCLVTRVAGAMRLSGCLGAEVGSFSTDGDGDFPGGGEVQRSVWAAALAGVAVEVAIVGPVGLGLDLDLNAPLQSRRVQVADDNGRSIAFEELPPLAFAATLGPVLRFD